MLNKKRNCGTKVSNLGREKVLIALQNEVVKKLVALASLMNSRKQKTKKGQTVKKKIKSRISKELTKTNDTD